MKSTGTGETMGEVMEPKLEAGKSKVIGYVRATMTKKWPGVVSRFRVSLSIQEPKLLKEKLIVWLENNIGLPKNQLIEKDTLPGVLEAFFDHKRDGYLTYEEGISRWIFYPVEEGDPPTGFGKMDYIFQVSDEYERKRGRKTKPWTHLTFYLSSDVKVKGHRVEATIRDWIDDATGSVRLGDLGTWVMAKPVKTLPDESIKHFKIPFTKAMLEKPAQAEGGKHAIQKQNGVQSESMRKEFF